MIIDLGKLEASDISKKVFSVEKVFEELHRTHLQIDRTTLRNDGQVPAEPLHQYQRRLLGELRAEVFDIFEWVTARGHNRSIETALLPPNLRNYCDYVSSSDVFDFVERSGIPFYGVPRGEIALQLIEADTIEKRRYLLNRYFSRFLMIARLQSQLRKRTRSPNFAPLRKRRWKQLALVSLKLHKPFSLRC